MKYVMLIRDDVDAWDTEQPEVAAAVMKEICPLNCALYSEIGTSRFGIGMLKRVDDTMYSVFSVTKGEA